MIQFFQLFAPVTHTDSEPPPSHRTTKPPRIPDITQDLCYKGCSKSFPDVVAAALSEVKPSEPAKGQIPSTLRLGLELQKETSMLGIPQETIHSETFCCFGALPEKIHPSPQTRTGRPSWSDRPRGSSRIGRTERSSLLRVECVTRAFRPHSWRPCDTPAANWQVFKRLNLIGRFGVTTGRSYCGVAA